MIRATFGDENGTYAKVIEDSVNEHGDRLTTMEVQFHRFVLAEFNTHRVFSRNSASSRAIPVAKQIERIRQNTAYPVRFPAEQKGMQGGDTLDLGTVQYAKGRWRAAALAACAAAEEFAEMGVHKSVTNRLLEPFMWHKVIVSSTEWENFFRQRCSPLAQPEIKEVAQHMQHALYHSEPKKLASGQMHLPYVRVDERNENTEEALVRISAARCARVSYLTHDGIRSIDADLELYSKLVSAKPAHWSPLEHVATPTTLLTNGNFQGWVQLRSLVESGYQQ